MDDDKVNCPTHGKQATTFVCQHLLAEGKAKAIGFYQADIDPDNREWGDLNAWCSKCEQVLTEEGDWTDHAEAFASIKVVCQQCFMDFKNVQARFNPEPAEFQETSGSEKDDAFWARADAFIDQANNMTASSDIAVVAESFTYAAARYNAFEAVATAENIARDRSEVVEQFCTRFRQMFIENLDDYEANKEAYFNVDDDS